MASTSTSTTNTPANVPVSQLQLDKDPVRTPRCDIFENKDEYLLVADLPGVDPSVLKVHAEKRELSLSAAVTWAQPKDARLTEFGSCSFERRFTVPEAVDADAARAEFKNGVLHLHLPKAKANAARQIPITVR